jgi:stage V sporulation protein SpoVS
MEGVQTQQWEDMKVSATTDPRNLAAVIVCSILNEGRSVVLSAVGPTATHVVLKAVAVAQEHAGPRGYFIGIVPSFSHEKSPDSASTVMVIKCAVHKLKPLTYTIVPALGV